ncbi:MAG: orotidine-5'-phosphate decarboxylase [Acidimicrobiales bacterium]
MANEFGARVRERVESVGPLCVGVDPSADALRGWGRDDDAEGAEFVALGLVDAAADAAAAVKLQVAFFERFGSRGFAVLERVMADAADAGLLVIADAKRADITSTNEGYASAWLDDASPLVADAVTVSAYLGVGVLHPFVARARATSRGVLVLAATSNVEGREVQVARRGDARTVEEWVLDEVAALNDRDDGRGAVGVVYGATRGTQTFELARLGGPCLVPGLGVQGASPADVARVTSQCAPNSVLASVSRSIAESGPDRRALRDAARRWRDDLVSARG